VHATHTRFIPREELHHFSAWTPSPLNLSGHDFTPHPFDPRDPQVGKGRAGEGPTPNAEAAPAAPAAPALSDEALEELQQTARQAGYHDGYRDGLAALESFKRSFAQQSMGQVGQLLQAFEAQLDQLEAQMADHLVRASVGLARQVLRQELRQHPGVVAQVALEAVGAMALAARHLQVQVHPEDVGPVSEAVGEALRQRGVQVLPSAHISRGGCLVESDLGTVDARLETRWAEALARLGVAAEDAPIGGEGEAP